MEAVTVVSRELQDRAWEEGTRSCIWHHLEGGVRVTQEGWRVEFHSCVWNY